MASLVVSRDFKLKSCVIAGVLLADVALLTGLDLYFPPSDAIKPILVTGLLAAFGLFYHFFRKVPSFVYACSAMGQLVIFSSCYTVLMYSVAITARPLVDVSLVRFDRWLGLEAPEAVAWAAAHPLARTALEWAYNTLLPQTALVVVLLGFLGDRKALETFILRFMMATLLTAGLFFAFPARGPFSAYGYKPNNKQARYLDHFDSLRSAERDVVTWRGAEGLITFPSFHTTWAVLLALAVRRRRRPFVFGAVLNCAVIVATLTTGWHYLSDVLGGMAVAGAVIALTHSLAGWLYPAAAGAPAAGAASSPSTAPAVSHSGARWG